MLPRILSVKDRLGVIKELKSIKVDDYGIKIMSPKADSYLIKIPKVSSIAANILKQEMLSLGGDVAISRQSITGKDKITDCLLMANYAQLTRLISKLRIQPFKLSEIAKDLDEVVNNYKKDSFIIKARNYRLNTKLRPLIVGIINVTPDSFSGDGLLSQINIISDKELKELVLSKAEQMIKQGVDIIDIGGESTRPGAKPVDLKTELNRVSLCVGVITKRFKIPISIDTSKPQVAKVALDLGASIINDITGFKNKQMRKLAAKYKAGIVIMHMKGNPRTMQKKLNYNSLIDDIIYYLRDSIDLALEEGIDKESIIIDPGIGFGKTVEHNLEIVRNLKEFKVLGQPILLGVSRKSFIGKILKVNPEQRIIGTAATIALAINEGANILRVHDVLEMRQAADISNAIIRGN